MTGEIPPVAAWEALGFPAALPAYLDWLESRGARELLWTPEPAAMDAVAGACGGRAFRLTVVLPNMSLYARDAMDAGPTGAVLKRLRALGPLSFVSLGLRLTTRVPALLEKRFSAGTLLLADAEYLRLGGLPVTRAALHGSATDLALALGGREVFDEFRAWAKKRGVTPLVATYNRAAWDARAAGWGLSDLAVLEAPISWSEFRPTTAAQRLDAWKSRARHFL